jgi:hypothetical protein
LIEILVPPLKDTIFWGIGGNVSRQGGNSLREGELLRSGRSDTRFSRGAANTDGPDTAPYRTRHWALWKQPIQTPHRQEHGSRQFPILFFIHS